MTVRSEIDYLQNDVELAFVCPTCGRIYDRGELFQIPAYECCEAAFIKAWRGEVETQASE